uniref:ER membrane protein complex subunit 2 n=1 Tax=Eptatretus burgeri TaxID=7764 RepID=A0A8C4QJB3_EPTBU
MRFGRQMKKFRHSGLECKWSPPFRSILGSVVVVVCVSRTAMCIRNKSCVVSDISHLCYFVQKILMFSYSPPVWIIHEQVFVAALDCSRLDLATLCLKQLRKQFTGSHRVRRLEGMRLEFMEKYEEANLLYDKIIQEDEANTAARKRKIAILKAQGRPIDAIRELNDYLKIFVADHEAWQELADLYIGELDYSKAAFCLEEVMMAYPYNHLYCQKYAEVKYTQGGLDNMELARKYFAQALRLNSTNMRALFGLYMVRLL